MKSIKNRAADTVLFFLMAAVFLLYPGRIAAEQSDSICLSSQWPSSVSELEPDPDLRQGQLGNGFRFAIKHNQEPKNRVAVFLYIKAGSLHEADDERGLAHFLEHMMFKGTENYPAGSMIDYFQSIGMDFGNDANAHTSFDQTVYKLILPSGSRDELIKGLSVMADFARRATLAEEQIDTERGVILAEKRSRDSASYRTQVASMEFAFRGTRLAERMVIGLEDTIKKADRPALKKYYESWYRPDNMVLILVGDTQPEVAAELVGNIFSNLSSAGEPAACPGFGKLSNQGVEGFYHPEPELGKTNVSIESFWDMPLQNDSLELETNEILRFMGELIMGYRLQRLQEEENVPFIRAAYGSGDILERIGYGSISAQTESQKWQESLKVIERVLRQAVQFGFSDQEVGRAKKEILADLDARVLTAKSEDSRKIAQKILRHLASNRVYQSSEQEKSLYGPIIEKITTHQVGQEFRNIWQNSNRLVSLNGDTQLGKDGAGIVVEAYRQASQEPVSSTFFQPDGTFPYLPISPSSANPPDSMTFPDIGVERLSFTNGLIVNLKKTDYLRNSVQIAAAFGSGKQSEPLPGMAMLAEDIINASGSGKLPKSAIDALVAGSSVDVGFRIRDNAFNWLGRALSRDFELMIQLLHTQILDTGFRENQFDNVMNKLELMYQKIAAEIDGSMALDVQPFLAGGNGHFGLPPWDELNKISFSVLEKWVQSFSRPKDLEISVTGDFDRTEVVRVLDKYFGGLIVEKPVPQEGPTVYFPEGKKLEVTVKTSIDKALVAVAWPTDDFWDIHRTRRLQILASIFEDRIRKVLRETLGAAYSPSVSNFNSRVYPQYGYLIAQVIVKPGSEKSIIKEILRIAEQLKGSGVSGDELLRAKLPLLTAIGDTVRTNDYWLSSVLTLSSRYPQQLLWPKTLLNDFSSIEEKEINHLAGRYLNNSRAALARIAPGGLAAKSTEQFSVNTGHREAGSSMTLQ